MTADAVPDGLGVPPGTAPVWEHAEPDELTGGFTVPAPELDHTREVGALIDADRHLAAIRNLNDHLAKLDRIYNAERRRLEDRYDHRKSILVRAIEWHTQPVRQLHERLVEEDSKRKTIELPNGTLRMRVSHAPRVWIDDMATVVEWALEAEPDLLPPPTKVLVTDLRKFVDAKPAGDGMFVAVDRLTGEIVPGCHAAMPDPTWSLDPEPGSAF